MSTAYSGITGNVISNSIDMDVKGWAADVETGDIDTTTTGDLGWSDSIDGPTKVSGTFDFFYNTAKSPFRALTLLMPGQARTSGTYPTLVLKTGGGDQLSGTARITKLSKQGNVPEGIMYTASFVGKGVWTVPT